MTRRDFLTLLGIMGLSSATGCASSQVIPTGRYDGRVLVIGAGAAGISAAHFLNRNGVDVTVLEAAPTYGGRLKSDYDFVDFPIPLGGEWLHTHSAELNRVTAREDHAIQMVSYGDTENFGYWEDGEFSLSQEPASADLTFVGRTWLDVFKTFLLPDIANLIRYNTAVTHIDYTGDQITVSTGDGSTHTADRLIVTAPIVQLRDNITFTPALPNTMRNALNDVILEELDTIFDGEASRTYLNHIAQDWSAEPHIGMAYLSSNANWRIPRRLATPIDNRIFLAGDAYIKDDEGWSMVHLAAKAGRTAVKHILT